MKSFGKPLLLWECKISFVVNAVQIRSAIMHARIIPEVSEIVSGLEMF